MTGGVSARGRAIRLGLSVLLSLLVFGVAVWQGIPTGGAKDVSRLLVSALLTALGVAQLAAAAWGFRLWRRAESLRARRPDALVQTCLVTAGTRDLLRGDRATGPAVRVSCCLVADRDGVAFVTSSSPEGLATLIPWCRIGEVGWGFQEGDTRIPNAVTFALASKPGSILAFIPIGRGFYALNPIGPLDARTFFDALRALRRAPAPRGD